MLQQCEEFARHGARALVVLSNFERETPPWTESELSGKLCLEKRQTFLLGIEGLLRPAVSRQHLSLEVNLIADRYIHGLRGYRLIVRKSSLLQRLSNGWLWCEMNWLRKGQSVDERVVVRTVSRRY